MAVLPEPVGLRRAEERMRRALAVARRTPPGDVPVGAVLYDATGRELSWGVNRREQLSDPTAHAEIEALRRGVAVHGDGWRLGGCELVVTLEPCPMCAGAIQGARVASVIFGAFEPLTGGCGSLVDVLRAPGALHAPQVRGGVCEKECAELLKSFFGRLR